MREGIIIADQLPTAMAPEVIKNTNIKLVHRLTFGDDRELVGSTMSASGLQMENMATYTSGQALFTYEKLLRPFEMQVSMVEQHGEETPNDDQLYELMSQKTGFKLLRQRIQDNQYNCIVEAIIAITEEERKKTAQLFDLNGIHFERIIRKKFIRFMDKCSSVLMSFQQQQAYLIREIDDLDSSYISENDKEELRTIALEIGNGFEISMKNFKKMYELKTGGI